jgi:hypothetical protein
MCIIIIETGKNSYDNKFGGVIMEKVCPLCNNIERKVCNCEKCSAIMEDKGIIQEFSDDYTANMEISDNNKFCIHMYQCSNCNFHKRIKVDKMLI